MLGSLMSFEVGDFEHPVNRCTFGDSWKQPLVNNKENSLNPCFLTAVYGVVWLVIFVFNLIEAGQYLWFNYFGPYKIKYSFGSTFNAKSVGIVNIFKFNSLFIQCILSLALLSFDFRSFNDIKSQALIVQSVVLIFGVLPLHLIETTRSLVASTSLLLFWLFNTIITFACLLQDTFSSHKIYIPDGEISIQVAIHTVEVLFFVNSLGIFIMESFFYKPSNELIDYFNLNQWDITSVRNLFTRFLFTYMDETIEKARGDDDVAMKNLPSYIIDVDNKVAYDNFLVFWNQSYSKWKLKQDKLLAEAKASGNPFKNSTPSLFIPVLRLVKGYFLRSLFFDFLEFAVQICQPYLLRYFLLFATNRYLIYTSKEETLEPQPIIIGFSLATLIYMAAVVRYISFNRNYYNSQTLGNIVQSSLSSHIYNKGMKLSPKERKNKTVGEIINNLSQDVLMLQYSPSIIIDIISQPIKLVFYIYTIYNFLGVAAIAGLIAALVLIPIGSVCFKFVYKQMFLQMKYKDQRSKLMNEILTSIKSIKLYSWEDPMFERLKQIRNDKELNVMKKIGIIDTFISLIWDSIPFAIAISTFISASLIGKVKLTPDVIFPALSIFALLTDPILALPNIFSNIAETKVSIERLAKLFVMEELEIKELERTLGPVKKGEESVTIKNATFLWTKETEEEKKLKEDSQKNSNRDEEQEVDSADKEISPVALKDIDFSAKKGELSCIVGKVGSGKTTLLKAILGCIPVDSENKTPTLKVKGTIAYCAQNAWVLNATVRENILFGRRYDKAFYKATIEACELSKDLEMLPDGDSTVVGEKGISLSGGQKARISLARAVYSKADIYILDDVLSAVDTHVGKKIIKNVLGKTGLLSSKTIILATNSVPVLHEAGSITLLVDGKITEQGTYDEVMGTDTQLAKLIKEFGKQGESKTGSETPEAKESEPKLADSRPESKATLEDEEEVQKYQPEEEADLTLSRVDTNVTVAPSFVSFGHSYDDDFLDDPSVVKKTGHTEEIQYKGKANLGIYKNYIAACGYINVLAYIGFVAVSTLLTISNTFVLKYWSEANAKYDANVRIGFFLTLYSIVGVLGLLGTMFASLILYCVVIINGSKYFHDSMAKSVLRSPMSFFETTPVGRILNRFTEDIGVLDSQLIWIISFFVSFVARAVSVFGVVIYNLPFMLLVIAVLLFAYDYFRRLFIPASKELKSLRSANKSPVFSHAQESFTGVDTIYAYNQADRFTYQNLSNLNKLTTVDQANLAAQRWLSMRLQGLSAVVVYCSTLLILLSLTSKNPIGPGLVGFVMTYILDVTATLNALVRCYAEIETRSVTIERLMEYINLKPEAEMVIEDNRPDPYWPQHGEITFKDYETKYRENLDPVLKDISINIKPTEKVGIVGRTGAGKSSLTLALFRIIEATKGHIEIDCIDTSKLGLFDLRSKLNIIPQDSHAIDGSVRENLDPFKKHTDDELWKVLELSHLKSHVESMKTEDKPDEDDEDSKAGKKDSSNIVTGLDARIEEGGSNLSAGQKQLMCLARALLNESKILILDEATASVDVETDKIVQDTIRSEFKDKTILTIAHRIETIMDSDRILVLDKGYVKEFDSPKELLKDTNGIFYMLCKQGGHI